MLTLGLAVALSVQIVGTAFDTSDDLDRTLRRELRRIQLRPHLIDGCLGATGLDTTPPTPPRQPQ